FTAAESDYVSCGDINELDSGDITVAFWAKVNNGGVIIGKHYSNFEIRISSTTFCGYVGTSVSPYYYDLTHGGVTHGVNITEWNHYVYVFSYSTGEVRLYANGVYKGTISVPNMAHYAISSNLEFGRRINSTGYFNGMVDNIRIYPHGIDIPVIIQTKVVYPGSLGVTYSRDYDAVGGTAPYTWSIQSGSLPSGLLLDSSTGIISGLPQAEGSYSFTLQVTDSNSVTETSQEVIEIIDQYEYSCNPPSGNGYYSFGGKNWMDEIDPAVALPALSGLSIAVAPGEYEPSSFVIYAADDLEDVQVTVSDLRKSNRAVILKENITARYGMRCFQRENKTYPVVDRQYRVTTRFLRTFDELDIEDGSFREIFVTVKVPENTPPGVYNGTIQVSPSNCASAQIPVSVEVMPFTLIKPEDKKYGIYYYLDDSATGILELDDIKKHGAGDVVFSPSGTKIVYSGTTLQNIQASYTSILDNLAFLESQGFMGAVVIGTGLENLACMAPLGYDSNIFYNGTVAQKAAMAAQLEADQNFRNLAATAINGLKTALENEFPDFEIYLTHMDEVFNNGRLPLYIALTKAAQQVSGFKYFVTIHTADAAADTMRAQIDPYVDFRHHHGSTWEKWLTIGGSNTITDYETELAASGDIAGIYYNPASIDYSSAEWCRIRTGMLNMIMPFTYQMPYIHSYENSLVFDDLNGGSGDLTFAFYWDDDNSIVYTKAWEGYREGVDDMQYYTTLQSTADDYASAKPVLSAAAGDWLDDLKGSFPDFTTLSETEASPVTKAIADAHDNGYYQDTRYAAASYIKRLLVNAHWNLDETSGTVAADSSGNGRDGTNNGASVGQTGPVGTSYSFTSVESDYVSCGDIDELDSGDITVAFWAKVNNGGVITGKHHSNFEIRISATTFCGYVGTSVSPYYYDLTNGSIAHGVDISEWNHYAYVLSYSTGEVRLYANGIYKGTISVPNMAHYAISSNLEFGRRYDATGYFDGGIDDMEIYSYPLTTEEIYHRYGNLVGCWSLNDASGTVASDSTVNPHNGTLNNMSQASWVAGIDGTALYFTGGDDYVSCGDIDALDSGDITVAFWAKVSNGGVIIGKHYSNFEIRLNATSFCGYVGTSTGGHWYNLANDGVTHGVDVAQWNRYVYVLSYSTGTVSLYVNGTYKGSISVPDMAHYATSSNLELGRRINSTGYFIGRLDEVKCYSYALTAEEVYSEYAQW
ncbi:MAG: DUF6067 family protein, partial [bacterium]|nr:DUF6067 family protein [bacterium]